MKSFAHGIDTSAVEVTNISVHGIWILIHEKELFISYEDFPWFRDKTVGEILNVVEQSPGHFHWPDLDIDLTEEIINSPDKFPLKAKIS